MVVLEDPEFALTHYRLGLAKQRDEQPGAVIKAFKASLKVDPSFVPGAIALASVMYDFERSSHLGEAGVLVDLIPNPQGRYRTSPQLTMAIADRRASPRNSPPCLMTIACVPVHCMLASRRDDMITPK
jgi:hypothetical protein